MKFERLGNICELRNGYAFKSENFTKEGVPIIRISDINDNLVDAVKSVRIKYEPVFESFKVVKGDILIAMSGATTGKFGIYILDEVAYQNQRVGCFKITDEQKLSYLYLLHSLKILKPKIEKKAYGGGQPNISAKNIEDIKIPLPSLPHQIQIANILNKAETLIEQRKKSIALLDEFLKSTFLEMFGDPVKNEKRWEKKNIGKFILSINNESPSKFPNRKYDYIDIAAINNKAKVIQSVKKIIGSEAPSRARQLVQAKDIIVSTVRPNLNAVSLIGNYYDNPIASTGFCVLRSNENINHEFLFMLCCSSYFINELVKKVKGANYPAVSDKDIKDVLIPTPPLKLQTQFANIVTKTEALKEHYKGSLQELENLYGSLSQLAFKGELKLDKEEESILMAAEPLSKYQRRK